MSRDEESAGELAQSCSVCGREVLAGEMIRVGDDVVCAACKPVYLQAVREGLPDDAVRLREQHSELASFIGSQSLWYLRAFERLAERPGKQSWNWPAFFLTWSWLLYRRMYFPAAVLILVDTVVTIIEEVVEVPLSLSVSFYSLYALAGGLWGNWLYRRHASAELQQLTSLPLAPETHAAQVIKSGGVNLRLAVTVTLLVVAAEVGIWWWLSPEDFTWGATAE